MKLKTPNFSSIARSIARQWGDVNTSYRTTQNFAYYFSCSGHGGYVISYDKLSDKQKADLVKWYGGEGKMYFTKVAFDARRGSYKANAWFPDRALCKEYQNLRFLCFEEDCEWAVATGILGIRITDETDAKFEVAKRTLKQWYPEQYEAFFGK